MFIDYNLKEFTELSMEINRPTITSKGLLPFWRVGTMAACCHGVGKCCSERLRLKKKRVSAQLIKSMSNLLLKKKLVMSPSPTDLVGFRRIQNILRNNRQQ